ncbi:MAG: TetR/AcrR family transcriptional regulator [Eggerthellaceae bacterium]|nr:TetR/AcrR family transcriptional regulator [Eggerthellaceae bacterium]
MRGGYTVEHAEISSEQLRLEANLDTKLAIVNALDTLMGKTSLDRLGVNHICEAAGVSRATFYRCFRDKFDVVEWFLRFLSAKGTDRIGKTLSWYEGYFISEALIMDNVHFFTSAAKSDDANSLDRIAPRIRRDRIFRTLTNDRGVEVTQRLRIQVNSVVLTETYLFPAWHNGKYDATLEEVCTWMCECIPQELFNLLNTPLKPQDPSAPAPASGGPGQPPRTPRQ